MKAQARTTLNKERSVPTGLFHWLWFARFDPRVTSLAVTDEFGNLVPIDHGQAQLSMG